MFEKFFDYLKEWLELFYFVHVVNCYERGVQLRWGKFYRVLEPGWRFFWPLRIDQIIVSSVILDTEVLREQTLTTKDDASVTLRGIVSFEVEDVQKYLLEVKDRINALEDSACGVIGARVLRCAWQELITEDFWNAVTIEVRRNAKKYGIKIVQVQFQDLTKSWSLRLWNSSTSTPNPP
jgi:Membrane protease subunits, stomatin/prohibitin homologs